MNKTTKYVKQIIGPSGNKTSCITQIIISGLLCMKANFRLMVLLTESKIFNCIEKTFIQIQVYICIQQYVFP